LRELLVVELHYTDKLGVELELEAVILTQKHNKASMFLWSKKLTFKGFDLSYLPPEGLAAARIEVRAFRVA
jgi:hypothetical protein